MRDFFHIGRVNGTIEGKRILWREGQAPGKKEDFFAFKKRGKRLEREDFPYEGLPGGWLEIEEGSIRILKRRW